MRLFGLGFVLFAESVLSVVVADGCNKEKPVATKLKEDLLCNYNKDFPPAIHGGNTTDVSLSMLLKSFSYESYTNLFTVNAWMLVFWKDPQLKWKPEDYKSIEKIHIPSSEIWTPDISIYNSHSQGADVSIMSSVNCLLHSSGSVVCVSPSNIDGLCIADVTKFPFDTQNCTLKMGSWVHSGEELNVSLPSTAITMEDYLPNGDWYIVKANSTKHPGKYDCCPNNTYPTLFFTFLIKRHSAHHVAVIVVPALAIVLLSLATLWLQPTDTNRFSMMCCNVLAHILYAEYISWQTPGNGVNAAYIAQFSRDSFLLSSLVVVITIVLKNIIESTMELPKWIPSVVSVITNNRAGRLILAHEYYVKGGSLMKNEEDEETNVAENTQNNDRAKDWLMFAKIVDRFVFIVFTIVYICMFFAFII